MYERSNGFDDVADIHRKMNEEEESTHQNTGTQKTSSEGLTISAADDPSEIQADQIASIVSGGGKVGGELGTGNLHAKHEGDSIAPPPGFSSKLSSTIGGGNAMDDSTLGEMESGLGANLGGVKIHTGSAADELSQSINAKAFAHGDDVYFRNGAYNPGSKAGKELLAHELVHTQQEKRNGVTLKRIHRKFNQDTEIFSFYKTQPTDSLDSIATKYKCGWQEILLQNKDKLNLKQLNSISDIPSDFDFKQPLGLDQVEIRIPFSAFSGQQKPDVGMQRRESDSVMKSEDVRSVSLEIKTNILNAFNKGLHQGYGNFVVAAQEYARTRPEDEPMDAFAIIGMILEAGGFFVGLFDGVEKAVEIIGYLVTANDKAKQGYDALIKPGRVEGKKQKAERELPNFSSVLQDAADTLTAGIGNGIEPFIYEKLKSNPGITKDNMAVLYLQNYFHREFWDLSKRDPAISVPDTSHAAMARSFYEFKIMSAATAAFEKRFGSKHARKKAGMSEKFGEGDVSMDLSVVAKQLKERVPLDMANIGRQEDSLDKNPSYENFYNYLSRTLKTTKNVTGLNADLEEALLQLALAYESELHMRKDLEKYIEEENKRIELRKSMEGSTETLLVLPSNEDEWDVLRKRIPAEQKEFKAKFDDMAWPYKVSEYSDIGLKERDEIAMNIALLIEQNSGNTNKVLDISGSKLTELQGYKGADMLPDNEELFKD